MRDCSGEHPSGFTFAPRETIRIALNLGPRNADRPDHVAAVLVNYVTRQSLRNGRVPLLESLEVSTGHGSNDEHFVYASCDVEVIDGEWGCITRRIEANRLDGLLKQRLRAQTKARRLN